MSNGKKYENRKRQKGCNRPRVCVTPPVTTRNVRAATALLGSGAADALSDAFDNGFI